MLPFLTALVNNWNYHIALEDGAVMQGQAHLIEDLNAARMQVGALGDDLMSRYWNWRKKAHSSSSGGNPWFGTLDSSSVQRPVIGTGTSYGDTVGIIEKARSLTTPLVNVGKSVGIKQGYVQENPEPLYAPMNSGFYIRALFFDDLMKKLFQNLESSDTMIKTSKVGTFDNPSYGTLPREVPRPIGEDGSPREGFDAGRIAYYARSAAMLGAIATFVFKEKLPALAEQFMQI